MAGSGDANLPVFNFINDPNHHMQAWREMLSRRALHVVNAFDTVAFDFENEMALWSNLSLLSNHDQNIEKLKQERSDTWHELLEIGSEMIADF